MMRHFLSWRAENKRRRSSATAAAVWDDYYDRAVFQAQKLDFASPTGLILDVGCGWSAPVRMGLVSSDVYVGIDPVVIEGANYPFPFVKAVAEALPFTDSLFGTVLFNSSFEHTLDPERAVHEAIRVSQPGARVVVSTASACQDREQPVDDLRMRNVLVKDVMSLLAGARCRSIETREFSDTLISIRAVTPIL
jgi:SAM-dependent methyltransferase